MARPRKKHTTGIHTSAFFLMKEKHLSQTELARSINCSLTTVNQILLGKRTSRAIQKQIAIALGFKDWESFVAWSDSFHDEFLNLKQEDLSNV